MKLTILMIAAMCLCGCRGSAPATEKPAEEVSQGDTAASTSTSIVTSGGSSGVATTVLHALSLKAQPDERILCENKPYSDEDLNQAALDVIQPKFPYWYSWQTPSPETLQVAKQKLAELYPWAKAIENQKIRGAYLSWLDFYRDKIATAEEALTKPAVETDPQREKREYREAAARASELARCLPRP